MYRYTKADLEKIVLQQLENLNAMNDLITIMQVQNDLIQKANKKLHNEITEIKENLYPGIKKKH